MALTELTAVCHAFCDEVHKYMNPLDDLGSRSNDDNDECKKGGKCNRTQTYVGDHEDVHVAAEESRKRKQPPHLSRGEKRHLSELQKRVRDRVDQESVVVLENRRLLKKAKEAKARVRDYQNSIMITRLLLRRTEGDVASLERHLRHVKNDEEKVHQASRFLSAVESLAAKAERKMV